MLKAKRRYESTYLTWSNGKVQQKLVKLWLAGMLSTTQALLTDSTNFQLSSSATYNEPKDSRFNNCLAGLNNQKFLTYNDGQGDCCAKTGNEVGVRFFQVKMADFTTIRTVLIANPEGDSNEQSLVGSDLFVGFGTGPGVACNALPKMSGVYDCKGLVGDFLRYELNTSTKIRFAVCEIRAYSLKANEVGYVEQYTRGKQSGCPNPPVESMLDNIPWLMKDQRCVEYAVSKGNTEAYLEVNLGSTRYVHAVTLVGNAANNWSASVDWKLTVGSGTRDQNTTYYTQLNSDKMTPHGIEVKVLTFGSKVSVFQTNNKGSLSFAWIGIFSTASDCQGTINISTTSVVTRVQVGSSDEIVYTVSLNDCPVASKATLSGDNPLPSFITFDAATTTFTISPQSNVNVGTYTLNLTAKSNNGATPLRVSQATKQIEVYCLQSGFTTQQSFSATYTIGSSSVTLDLPVLINLPATDFGANGITVSSDATSPVFISVLGGQQAVIQASSVSTQISQTITFTARHKYCANEQVILLYLNFKSPNGLRFSSNSVSINVRDPISKQITWANFDALGHDITSSSLLMLESTNESTDFSQVVTIQGTSIDFKATDALLVGDDFTVNFISQVNETFFVKGSLTLKIIDQCNNLGIVFSMKTYETWGSQAEINKDNYDVINNIPGWNLSFVLPSLSALDGYSQCQIEWNPKSQDAVDVYRDGSVTTSQTNTTMTMSLGYFGQYKTYTLESEVFIKNQSGEKVSSSIIIYKLVLNVKWPCSYSKIVESGDDWRQKNSIFQDLAPLESWSLPTSSFTPFTYSCHPLQSVAQCNICQKELLLDFSTDFLNWMSGSDIQNVFYMNPQIVFMRLTGNLKNNTGLIITDTLSIFTKLDLKGLCLKYNFVTFDPNVVSPDPGFITISNEIKKPAAFVELNAAVDTYSILAGSEQCGPIAYQLFRLVEISDTSSEIELVQDNKNEFLTLIVGDNLQLVLQTNEPMHAVDEAQFLICAYKKNLFDISLVKSADIAEWYSPSVVATKFVKVSLFTCRVQQTSFKWPVEKIDIKQVVGDPPTKAVHSDLKTAVQPCTFPVTFKLYWDSEQVVTSTNYATFDFTQLSPGLPSSITYSASTYTISVDAQAAGLLRLYLVGEVTEEWQIPAVKTVLPVVVTISPKLAIISNQPPLFPEPLPFFSIETGTSGSFDLPIATAIDPEGDSITSKVKLPLDASYITFDSSTNKLWVNGPKALVNHATGSHKYTIELSDGKGAIAEFSGSIEFTPTSQLLPQLPELAYKSVVDPIIIPAGQNKRIYLPGYVGEEPVQEKVEFGKTKLLEYDSDKRVINLIGRQNKDNQDLEVMLTIADQLGQVVSQKIVIKILKVSYTGMSDDTKDDYRILKATIQSIDAAGKVDITFSENVVSYEHDELDKITKALIVEGYRFDEATQDFTIQVPFDYQCIKLADKTLQIQLYFEEPIEVSAQSIPDRLFVTFANETFFQSSLDFTMIEPQYTVSSTIPPQFASLDSARQVIRATKVANGGSYLILVGLIVGQMAGKSVIKRIWSLFMALQIAVLVLDYETMVMPATCEQITKSIRGILTIDALDPVKLIQKTKPALASKLLDPNSFFGNINPLVLGAIAVIAAGTLVAAGHFIVKKVTQSQDSRVKKAVEYLKNLLMYNSIIVSLQTSYLQLWITTSRLLKNNIHGYTLYRHAQVSPAATHRVLQEAEVAFEEPKSLKSLIMDTVQVFVFTAGLTFVIVKVAMIIEKNDKHYFRSENAKKRLGALYSKLETSPKAKLHFATFFFIRRLLVAAVLIFGYTSFIKVELIGIISFAAIYYLIVYSPFVDPFDQKIEILNETCIIICNYWQMAFSDLLWDSPKLRSNLSYCYIFILLLMIAINLYFMIKRTIYSYLKTLITEWIRKRQHQASVDIQASQQPEEEVPQHPLPQVAARTSQDLLQVVAGTQMMINEDYELVDSEHAEVREYPIANLLPDSHHVSRTQKLDQDFTRAIGLEQVDEVYMSSDEENQTAQKIIKKDYDEQDEVFISSDEDYYQGEHIMQQAASGNGVSIANDIEDLYKVASNIEQVRQPAPFSDTWSKQQSDQLVGREVQLAGNVPAKSIASTKRGLIETRDASRRLVNLRRTAFTAQAEAIALNCRVNVPETPHFTKQFLSPDFVQNIATVIDTSVRTPEVTGAKIPAAATRLAIFPDQPRQLQQGESQWSTQHKCQLQYVMPQSDKWVRRAYACSIFVIPDFTSHDSKARREMILKECSFHWLTPEQSGQVADRFEAVFLDPASLSPSRQLDKQVIWIVAALNQRYVEQVHEQKNAANQRWTETLKQRETIKTKLKTEWDQKKSLKQQNTVPDLSTFLSQAELRARFIAECKAQNISEAQTSFLLERWTQMRPGNPVRTERDRYVVDILATIMNDYIMIAADDGYTKELAKLEETWQQEDIAIFEELSRLQDIITYYQY